MVDTREEALAAIVPTQTHGKEGKPSLQTEHKTKPRRHFESLSSEALWHLLSLVPSLHLTIVSFPSLPLPSPLPPSLLPLSLPN